jgi:hypothetical protein
LIDAISPNVVPTSSQTVAHVTYSKVTRTVAGSKEGGSEAGITHPGPDRCHDDRSEQTQGQR